MITLSLKASGAVLGPIDEADLQMLVDRLEEEYETDTDYYITPMTIEFLRQRGASSALIRLLEQAVGDSEGAEIVWGAS